MSSVVFVLDRIAFQTKMPSNLWYLSHLIVPTVLLEPVVISFTVTRNCAGTNMTDLTSFIFQ